MSQWFESGGSILLALLAAITTILAILMRSSPDTTSPGKRSLQRVAIGVAILSAATTVGLELAKNYSARSRQMEGLLDVGRRLDSLYYEAVEADSPITREAADQKLADFRAEVTAINPYLISSSARHLADTLRNRVDACWLLIRIPATTAHIDKSGIAVIKGLESETMIVLGFLNDRWKFQLLTRLAHLYWSKSQSLEAERLYEKAIAIADRPESPIGLRLGAYGVQISLLQISGEGGDTTEFRRQLESSAAFEDIVDSLFYATFGPANASSQDADATLGQMAGRALELFRTRIHDLKKPPISPESRDTLLALCFKVFHAYLDSNRSITPEDIGRNGVSFSVAVELSKLEITLARFIPIQRIIPHQNAGFSQRKRCWGGSPIAEKLTGNSNVTLGQNGHLSEPMLAAFTRRSNCWMTRRHAWSDAISAVTFSKPSGRCALGHTFGG